MCFLAEQVNCKVKAHSYTCTGEQAKLAEKVSELHDWMAPLGKLPLSSTTGWEDCVDVLISQLKDYSKDVDDTGAKGLVTTLRILRHLAVPPSDASSSSAAASTGSYPADTSIGGFWYYFMSDMVW